MKALPTRHRGILMRSRLEADWAMTLDEARIDWQYEPEGFQLSDGTCYSPDFYLPALRGWMEVKGDHHERVDKVEQFAADLWRESGCTSTYDTAAPLVLLGQTPTTGNDYPLPPERPRMLGVMGPGKRYSVGFTRCERCEQASIIALWQDTCRICNAQFNDGHGAFFGAWVDNSFYRRFARVPRPAGRTRT